MIHYFSKSAHHNSTKINDSFKKLTRTFFQIGYVNIIFVVKIEKQIVETDILYVSSPLKVCSGELSMSFL